MATQRFLVRRETNEAFIWTEILSKRADLAEVYANSAAEALSKDAMPDPRRISIAELEDMNKSDLIIFAKARLGIELDAGAKKDDMLDAVKLALFTRPKTEDAGTKPAAEETTKMSSAADARRKAGA